MVWGPRVWQSRVQTGVFRDGILASIASLRFNSPSRALWDDSDHQVLSCWEYRDPSFGAKLGTNDLEALSRANGTTNEQENYAVISATKFKVRPLVFKGSVSRWYNKFVIISDVGICCLRG